MHALIIEDEPFTALLIEDFLRDAGYTSFAFAASSEEAVAAAQDQCPQLITADVRLAEKVGTVIDTVRAICRRDPVPVIFVTAHGEEVRRSLADAIVVQKPFAKSDLVQAIAAAGSRSMPR